MLESILITLFTPVLLTIGGIISWLIKTKREELIEAENKSRDSKIDTYKKILEPFIATLTFTLSEKQREKEINKLTTLDYKKSVFDLTTFGSDDSLRTFNKLMQTFYHQEKYKDDDSKGINEYTLRLLVLISEFLFQIRKDIYTKKSSLQRSEMIEFILTDIEDYQEQINHYKLN